MRLGVETGKHVKMRRDTPNLFIKVLLVTNIYVFVTLIFLYIIISQNIDSISDSKLWTDIEQVFCRSDYEIHNFPLNNSGKRILVEYVAVGILFVNYTYILFLMPYLVLIGIILVKHKCK